MLYFHGRRQIILNIEGKKIKCGFTVSTLTSSLPHPNICKRIAFFPLLSFPTRCPSFRHLAELAARNPEVPLGFVSTIHCDFNTAGESGSEGKNLATQKGNNGPFISALRGNKHFVRDILVSGCCSSADTGTPCGQQQICLLSVTDKRLSGSPLAHSQKQRGNNLLVAFSKYMYIYLPAFSAFLSFSSLQIIFLVGSAVTLSFFSLRLPS